MKYRLLLLCLLMFSSAMLKAQGKGYGIGIIIGEPTGISGKMWLSKTNAIDAGLAWSFVKPGSIHLHGDYLWHTSAVVDSSHKIPLYFGIGGRLKFGDKETGRVGVRITGGVDFMLESAPIDIFIELAPIMDLVPATELAINGGIGARFFFQ